MGNKIVSELRAEAKRLGLKRYSRLRKQDLLNLISSVGQILDHLEIDAPFLTPTRYVPVKLRLGESLEQQRRNEIRGIEEVLGLRNRPEAMAKIKVSSPEEVEQERKFSEIKEINRKSIQLELVKQPAH